MELTMDAINEQLLSTPQLRKNPLDFIIDDLGDLRLLCIYNNDGVTSSIMQDVGMDDRNSTYIHRARGIIFNRYTGKCVNDRSMYPYEYQSNSIHEKRMKNDFEKHGIDISKLKISWAIEGTVLRVFNFKNKWYICTHRKLDADKSSWRTFLSFKKMFEEVVKEGNFEEFCNLRLDPSLQYTFLLTANENTRFVCNPSKKHQPLYIIEIFDFEKKEILDQSKNPFKDITYVPNIEFEPKSLDNAFRLVQDLKFDYKKFSLQEQSTEFGIMMHCPVRDIRFRIVNETYQKYFNILGNAKWLENQYYKNIGNEEHLSIIKYINPNMIEVFKKIDAAKSLLPRQLMRLLAIRLRDKTSKHLKPRYEWARGFEATMFCQRLECLRELIQFSKKEKNIKDEDVEKQFPHLFEAVKISVDNFLTNMSGRPNVQMFVHIHNYPAIQKEAIVIRNDRTFDSGRTFESSRLENNPSYLTVKHLSSDDKAMSITIKKKDKPFLMFHSNTFHMFASNATLFNIRPLDFTKAVYDPDGIKEIYFNERSSKSSLKIYFCDFQYRSSDGKTKVLTICVSSKKTFVPDRKRSFRLWQIKEFINNVECRRKENKEIKRPVLDQATTDLWRGYHDQWANDIALRTAHLEFK